MVLIIKEETAYEDYLCFVYVASRIKNYKLTLLYFFEQKLTLLLSVHNIWIRKLKVSAVADILCNIPSTVIWISNCFHLRYVYLIYHVSLLEWPCPPTYIFSNLHGTVIGICLAIFWSPIDKVKKHQYTFLCDCHILIL